ncbi:hypothetical protein GE21DRAFT_1037314 [Neurospora crassa]|nr:hypothetical protein GE21DRAFT_1037314 [Neurospora crassa]
MNNTAARGQRGIPVCRTNRRGELYPAPRLSSSPWLADVCGAVGRSEKCRRLGNRLHILVENQSAPRQVIATAVPIGEQINNNLSDQKAHARSRLPIKRTTAVVH